MSGPSRAEIVEMRDQWRGWLSKFYPGYAPEQVCPFYADLEDRLKGGTGTPDQALRNLGRLLKGHLDSDMRGLDRNKGHMLLLAGHDAFYSGRDLSAVKKEARREWNKALKDSSHRLHSLLPEFDDGVLVVRSDPARNLGQLLRDQLARKSPTAA